MIKSCQNKGHESADNYCNESALEFNSDRFYGIT